MADVAAILCSSGTTGLPKGVMLTNANFLHGLLYLTAEKYGKVKPGDVTASVLPYFHIFGLFVLISSTVCSMKLIDVGRFKPDVFLKCLQDYKVTRLFIVPSLAIFLAKTPLIDNYDLSSIDDVTCGAASLGKEVEMCLSER